MASGSQQPELVHRHRYFPALDGVRGLAVIVVLIAHLTPIYRTGAFGVDTFFVLSGFLITSILADELDRSGRIRLWRFYTRRALRLMPALWVTVLGSVLAVAVLGSMNAAHLREAVYALLYVTNWVHALALDPQSRLVLGHTWSLAVEEQYYLIWPAVLLAVHRLGLSSSRKAILFLVGAVACQVYRNLWDFDPIRVYRGLDTHCDGLLIGSALAYAFRAGWMAHGVWFWRVAAWVSLVFLLVLPIRVGWQEGDATVWAFAAAAVASGLLIGELAQRPGTFLGRLFSLWILRYCGRISYGLYLYHWPIWALVNRHPPPGFSYWPRVALVVVMTIVVSVLSYRFIEQPFLKLKDRFSYKPG
ncbi:MAG: acyltransferase [Planctomycetota bacterium]